MRRLVAQLAAFVAAMVMAVPASADDAQIAKQIISKLNQQKQAANLKGFDLGVQVDKGTVTMMGQVASADQAMLALDAARRVPGVKLVVNDLYVKQGQPQRAATPQPTPAAQPAKTPVQPAVAQQPTPATQPVQAVALQQAQPQRPVPFAQSTIQRAAHQASVAPVNYVSDGGYSSQVIGGGYGGGIVSDSPALPSHAWPSYAASPNYGAVAYPQQYSATAWPYIGPFYPYPQVPLGWRKVSLEWDDGWWYLDFTSK